jgi:hypothetical protein
VLGSKLVERANERAIERLYPPNPTERTGNQRDDFRIFMLR